MSEPNSPTVSESAPPSTFNLGRVLGTVLGIAILGGAGYLVTDYLTNRPLSFVKVTGRVTWDGQPVSVGSVMTLPVDNPHQPSIGPLSAEGRFELTTNGVSGAVVGTHKVMVASYGSGAVPAPLVPGDYLKPATTPLTIEVTEDAAKNHFELQVVGKRPGQSQPASESAPSGENRADVPGAADSVPKPDNATPAETPPVSQ